MEPPSPLISWVNPFPSRFINRTVCFPRKVSYFGESRMSPWKKWSWMKSNSEARPSTVFLFYFTSIFTILQPLGSGFHEIKVNELRDWDKGCELRITERLSAAIHPTSKHAPRKESTIKRSVDDLELFDDQRRKSARIIWFFVITADWISSVKHRVRWPK